MNLKSLTATLLLLCFSIPPALAASIGDKQPQKSNGSLSNDQKFDHSRHQVEAIVLFDEIYDIDLSGGHYKVSVELMSTWRGDTKVFLKKFGDEIIHGPKLDKFLQNIWHPEFFIANAENPRTTHYKTLDIVGDKYELFERFEVDLSIDAIMPRYPFGELDLYMEVAAFSGNVDKMQWVPEKLLIGHEDAHHIVVKGSWALSHTNLEEQSRSSLNHGGKEKFSYLISHVNVKHNASTAIQIVIFPLAAIIMLTLLFNHFFNSNVINSGNPKTLNDFADLKVGGQLTLFLTIPALKFALADHMPTTHYLNLADGLFMLATILVAFNLLISILTHQQSVDGFTERSHSIEKASKILSPLVAIVLFVVVLYLTPLQLKVY